MSKTTIGRIALYALGTAVVLQAILPFIYPIVGDDAWIHLNWIEQFPKLFLQGEFYPRMLPEGFWGFGSPAFYFYPPLTAWFASVTASVVDSPLTTFRILELSGTILSAIACYFYLRSLKCDKQPSLFGALMYGVFPYRIIDLYLRSALGEHLSFIFLPLILLSIEIVLQPTQQTKRISVAAIAISTIGWAGLLLINVPASIIMMYSAMVYGVIRAGVHTKYRRLFFPACGALIAAMISAVYYLPAAAFSSAIKLTHLWDVQRSQWDIVDAFRGIFEGVHRYFSVALTATVMIALFLLFLLFIQSRKKIQSSLNTIFIVFVFIVIFFQLPAVSGALKFLPLLKYIQFGFRWDMLLVLTAAVYVARFYHATNEVFVNYFILAASIITISIGIGYYVTESKVDWHYAPTSEHMDAPEYLPASANDNYVSAMNLLKDHAADPEVFAPEDSSKIQIIATTPSAIEFSIKESPAPVHAVFHRIFFPTWKLRSSKGDLVSLSPDSLGRSTAVLPGRPEIYKLSLEESQMEKLGKSITYAGLSLLMALVLLTIFWRNPKAS